MRTTSVKRSSVQLKLTQPRGGSFCFCLAPDTLPDAEENNLHEVIFRNQLELSVSFPSLSISLSPLFLSAAWFASFPSSLASSLGFFRYSEVTWKITTACLCLPHNEAIISFTLPSLGLCFLLLLPPPLRKKKTFSEGILVTHVAQSHANVLLYAVLWS